MGIVNEKGEALGVAFPHCRQWGSIDMTQTAAKKSATLPMNFSSNNSATGYAGSIDANLVNPCGVVVNKSTITIKTTGASSWTKWVAIGF